MQVVDKFVRHVGEPEIENFRNMKYSVLQQIVRCLATFYIQTEELLLLYKLLFWMSKQLQSMEIDSKITFWGFKNRFEILFCFKY